MDIKLRTIFTKELYIVLEWKGSLAKDWSEKITEYHFLIFIFLSK